MHVELSMTQACRPRPADQNYVYSCRYLVCLKLVLMIVLCSKVLALSKTVGFESYLN